MFLENKSCTRSPLSTDRRLSDTSNLTVSLPEVHGLSQPSHNKSSPNGRYVVTKGSTNEGPRSGFRLLIPKFNQNRQQKGVKKPQKHLEQHRPTELSANVVPEAGVLYLSFYLNYLNQPGATTWDSAGPNGSPARPGKLEVGWSRGSLVPDWLQSCCLEILLKIQNCQYDSLEEGDPGRAIFHMLRNSQKSATFGNQKAALPESSWFTWRNCGFPRMDTLTVPF